MREEDRCASCGLDHTIDGLRTVASQCIAHLLTLRAAARVLAVGLTKVTMDRSGDEILSELIEILGGARS